LLDRALREHRRGGAACRLDWLFLAGHDENDGLGFVWVHEAFFGVIAVFVI
jgi:hypothetical protein